MRTCPFCAEEIQDAAVVCKHCGRELGPGPASPTPPASGTKPTLSPGMKVLRYVMVGVALYLVAVLVYGALHLGSRSPDALPAALRETVHINIGNQEPVTIASSGGWHSMFTLPDRTCTVTGRIVGVSGGNKDFQAFITDDDGYRNWENSRESRVLWQTEGQVAAATFSASIQGPGVYHLVISNRFSLMTDKVVTVSGLAECP